MTNSTEFRDYVCVSIFIRLKLVPCDDMIVTYENSGVAVFVAADFLSIAHFSFSAEKLHLSYGFEDWVCYFGFFDYSFRRFVFPFF